MISKVLAFSLIGAGCVAAAAGGAYVALRQNAAPVVAEAVAAPSPATASSSAQPASQPVAETEALVEKPADTPPAPEVVSPAPATVTTEPKQAQVVRMPRPAPARSGGVGASNGRRAEAAISETPAAAQPATPERAVVSEPAPPVATPPAETAAPEPPRPVDPPPPPQAEFEEVVVPAGAVIGLQVTTPLSSERTQVEDRVEARVTRDVTSAGRVAIPAGSRAIGSVTVVERGGKMKDRARLGVRFHTLVLADGSEMALRTDSIFREGQSPTGESARKIGGAAVGGAILGAILGGGKGAAIGGATGAAGGTAVVMAGDRNAAVLSAGETVTVRLTSPVSVEVRKEK